MVGEDPSSIYATASSFMGGDDTAVVVLKFPNGALCVIDNSRQTSYGYDVRMEVLGPKGMATLTNPKQSSVIYSSFHGHSIDTVFFSLFLFPSSFAFPFSFSLPSPSPFSLPSPSLLPSPPFFFPLPLHLFLFFLFLSRICFSLPFFVPFSCSSSLYSSFPSFFSFFPFHLPSPPSFPFSLLPSSDIYPFPVPSFSPFPFLSPSLSPWLLPFYFPLTLHLSSSWFPCIPSCLSFSFPLLKG